ncbi:MAG: hypothetical protein DRJ60_04575 [Thermoprotei archaeon]|nr:MAG: hypothetical protein DRJ60_04575 [Thermoprotei archaeon]
MFNQKKLKLVRGTRLVSFLFIATSIAIAAGILFAANVYYNIDTGEIVTEEIQRVTNVIRATGGAIVGGSATQNPSSGYSFEVVGKTKLATTTLEGYLIGINSSDAPIRFATTSGGDYVGFKAPSGLTTTTVYTWPTDYPEGSGYLLQADASGVMSWTSPAGAGLGDITAVGDVGSGEAFTSGGSGTTLWFHSGSYTGALTIDSLSNNATYTLPDISGTNYFALSSGNLGSGGVLFADNGLIATSSNLQWDNSNRYLTVGSSGTEGQLRVYSSNASGYYLGFAATSTMTQSTLYYWPADYGTNNYVLTTDGSGQLAWTSLSGVGGIDTYGSPAAQQVAFFYDSDTIMGDSSFTWSTSTDTLTIAGTIVADTFTSNATTTIQSASGYGILLDPNSGVISLGSGDYIRTASGYEIGKAGKQVLREMIPVFGFDLPAQTATTSYVQFSRTIEDYPFPAADAGATRIHKFIIRYADATTTASTTWRVYNETVGTTTATFEVPATASTNLDKGEVYITSNVAIPTNTDDWRLDLLTPGTAIRVYQIFLAAYDQIQ